MTQLFSIGEHRVHPHAPKPRHSGSPEAIIDAVGLQGLVKRYLCRLQDCLGLFVVSANGRQHGETNRLKRQRSGERFPVRSFKIGQPGFEVVHLQPHLCWLMTALSVAGAMRNPIVHH